MTDVNYRSYWAYKNIKVEDEYLPPAPLDPKKYSDILKFSLCEDMRIIGCTIQCGTENCSDAVRGLRYLWESCIFKTDKPGYGALTIKGSIQGWTLNCCQFIGHGDKFDVEVGQFDNYWYPFRKATSGGLIANCTSPDDKPIVVELWNADIPQVIGSNVKIVKIPWIVWFPYFCFRYVQTKITQ